MALLPAFYFAAGCKKQDFPLPPGEVNKIKHVVVIYLENHSFDNLYGSFPGANGLSDARARNIIQVDSNDKPYQFLPAIKGTSAFPTNLAIPFLTSTSTSPTIRRLRMCYNRYYQEQLQIDAGRWISMLCTIRRPVCRRVIIRRTYYL